MGLPDVIFLLGYLVLGEPGELPCGDGTSSDPTNRMLLDSNGDGIVNISDCIYELQWIVLCGRDHVLDRECVAAPACPESAARCR